MLSIGTHSISDADVMEALIPGSTMDADHHPHVPQQHRAIPIRGLTPGVALKLSECCHPVPGDRIVGLRHPGESIEVHTIDCTTLESGVDADWADLSWDRNTTGGTARLSVILKNDPGALAAVPNIFGARSEERRNGKGGVHTGD